jgi:hypothetical protein
MTNVSSWTEGILLTLAFIAVLGVVVGGFNVMYDKDYDVGISNGNDTSQLFIEYEDTAQQQIGGGDVDFDAQQGITLKSSYGLTKDAINIIWSFFSGGFIEDIVGKLNLGEAGTILATAIRILWFLSLVFALLYALFKIII